MGGWREVIDRGALDGARLDDLIATREHDREEEHQKKKAKAHHRSSLSE